MIDWTAGMKQWYEYWEVSPVSWADIRMLDNVSGGSIMRNTSNVSLGSASFKMTDFIGEMYIRTYLCVEQNHESQKVCLGTHLVQSPNTAFNGKVSTVNATAYTPLIELKENYPPIFYTIPKGTEIISWIYNSVTNNSRIRVERNTEWEVYSKYDYVANTDDTWLDFIVSVMRQNNISYGITPEGVFYIYEAFKYDRCPSTYFFTTDDKSIILPNVSYTQDIYNIPNVVEVYTSNAKGYNCVRIINDGPNATSVTARGREIVYRETSPSILGIPSDEEITIYATKLLESLSTIKVELSFEHAYVPEVNIGDTITIDYPEAGIFGQKALVLDQQLDCSQGLIVSTTASFERQYWTRE